MTNEIRALLAQMAKELDNYLQRTACDPKVVHPLATRARAVLAAEPPAPVPADHVPDAGNMVAPDDEREELAQWLERIGDDYDDLYRSPSALIRPKLARAAALLRQFPPEGLAAVEYFHIASSARIVGEASEKWGECWNVYNSRHINPCTEFRTVADAVAALQQARHKEVGDE